MKVLLPIHPHHIERIFSGQKVFEYRRRGFANPISSVIIYGTMPIGKIVGEFEVLRIIEGNPAHIWELTASGAGIKEADFNLYFKDRDFGTAIQIGRVTKYRLPIDPRNGVSRFKAPQSFAYVTPEIEALLGIEKERGEPELG